MDDGKAQQLGDWLVALHKQTADTARAFFRDNPSSRTVAIQPTVPGPFGQTVELGEPIVFHRKGLGL